MPEKYLNINPDDFEKALIITLEKLYKKSGISRKGIAANMGVSVSCIDKLMQGRNKVGFSQLMHMLQAMQIRPSAFFRLYQKELKKFIKEDAD
jgi:transcriptional regulator with XRE-family HTH domain